MIATSVDGGSFSAMQRKLLVPIVICSMVAGGLFSGALVSALGALSRLAPETARDAVLIIFCGWACVVDVMAARVPTNHWQVPRTWAYWPWPRFHVAFAFILGMGWLTVVPFASYYLLVAALVALGNTTTSLVMMTLFALARTVPLLVMTAGVFREVDAIGAGARAMARRRMLHRVADSRLTWLLRSVTSSSVSVMLLMRQ